jgi:hypothetical protein
MKRSIVAQGGLGGIEHPPPPGIDGRPWSTTRSVARSESVNWSAWLMSYSRWADDRFWPQFRDAVLKEHPEVAASAMDAAREHNFKRYHYQDIGRFDVEAVYARGIANLRTLDHLVDDKLFIYGDQPRSVDGACYGFLANMLF